MVKLLNTLLKYRVDKKQLCLLTVNHLILHKNTFSFSRDLTLEM